MIQYEFKAHGKWLAIAGFTDAHVNDLDSLLRKLRESTGANVQLFDANKIAGPDHLYFACLNALEAFKNNANISKSIDFEILLYASGQRQIKRAIEMLGVSASTRNVAVVYLSNDLKPIKDSETKLSQLIGTPNDSVLAVGPDKVNKIVETFSISKREMEVVGRKGMGVEEVLSRLVVERVALLRVQL